MKKNKNLNYYMSLNYPFSTELYEEDGEIRFGLEIPDLQGVWAEGNNIKEAYDALMESKKLWFETCLEKGIDIPEPVSEKEYSGKFVLRLTSSLHRTLSRGAKKNKISLNQYTKELLEKNITTSNLTAEIKTLINMSRKQSETIEGLKQEITLLNKRLGSLENAFSGISEMGGWTQFSEMGNAPKKGLWGEPSLYASTKIEGAIILDSAITGISPPICTPGDEES